MPKVIKKGGKTVVQLKPRERPKPVLRSSKEPGSMPMWLVIEREGGIPSEPGMHLYSDETEALHWARQLNLVHAGRSWTPYRVIHVSLSWDLTQKI